MRMDEVSYSPSEGVSNTRMESSTKAVLRQDEQVSLHFRGWLATVDEGDSSNKGVRTGCYSGSVMVSG
jgi:hypothetical protein